VWTFFLFFANSCYWIFKSAENLNKCNVLGYNIFIICISQTEDM
jgi:hypothetical protein